MSTDFVLNALEQALHARRAAGVAASVGTTGDAHDNTLVETINRRGS